MFTSWLSYEGGNMAEGFHDPDDPHFVDNKELDFIGGGVVAGIASLPFVALLDTVSDSILYCDALVKQYSQAARAAQEGWFGDAGSFVADVGCACAGSRAKAPRELPPEFGSFA